MTDAEQTKSNQQAALQEGDFTRLIPSGEVPEGGVVQVTVDGREPFAVYNLGGEYFVTDDTCTHGEASLADGDVLASGEIECPFHAGAFNIRTGEATQFPCTDPIAAYPVRVIDGHVCAALDAGHKAPAS